MRYVKVQITAWRDSALRRSTDTQRQLITLDAREDAAKIDAAKIDAAKADAAKPKTASPAIAKARADRTTVLALEIAVARAAIEESWKHGRVGQFGYQEISDDGTTVLALKDDSGQQFPASAAIEYEIVDLDPPMPIWGTAPPVPEPPAEPAPPK